MRSPRVWTSMSIMSDRLLAKKTRSNPVAACCAASAVGSSRRNRDPAVEPATLGGQLLEQRRRLPVVAEPRVILLHPLQDRGEADRVGVEHRAAAVSREAEAVDVNDVDEIGRAHV